MTRPILSDADFIRTFETEGPSSVARQTGQLMSGVFRRRRNLERKLSRRINAPDDIPQAVRIRQHPERVQIEVKNGVVLVGSDGHYWPGEASLAHRAFVKFAKDLKPAAIIYNGDAFDGASISRHPPIGWTRQPTVQEELEACQDRMHEIASAAPRGCKRIWAAGNHDLRFETRLATVAPEYAKVVGTSLQDHFPAWTPCYTAFINDDRQGVVVTHKLRGGNLAPMNNALWSGRSFVTGHQHNPRVQSVTDYNGTRHGIDAGMLADPRDPAFVHYTADGPKNWIAGFCVLTFRNGRLLWPELVTAFDEKHMQFRGELIRI